jgi:hypothetical protein
MKRKPKSKPSLAVKLASRKEVKLVTEVKNIIEMRSRGGRIIKPTAKHRD